MRRRSRKRVGVVMGGWSAEHDVSLHSGTAVAKALAARGHEVVRVVVPPRAKRRRRGRTEVAATSWHLVQALCDAEVDVVFLALHGRMGEDGCVQGMLEIAGIPYTGSGVLASALAMDKVKAKELFQLHNVPTPPSYAVSMSEDFADLEQLHRHFGFPVIVKPRGEGSSLALTKASSLTELARALQLVFQYDDWALVERFVEGVEVNVGILDGQVLGAVEIAPQAGLYDYHAKYTPGATAYHLPPRLRPALCQGVLNLASRAADALGCTGVARVDLLVTPNDNEYVLEVNTVPGMTETSLLPKIATAAGYEFGELCEAILDSAQLHAPVRHFEQRGEPQSVTVPVPRERLDEAAAAKSA